MAAAAVPAFLQTMVKSKHLAAAAAVAAASGALAAPAVGVIHNNKAAWLALHTSRQVLAEPALLLATQTRTGLSLLLEQHGLVAFSSKRCGGSNKLAKAVPRWAAVMYTNDDTSERRNKMHVEQSGGNRQHEPQQNNTQLYPIFICSTSQKCEGGTWTPCVGRIYTVAKDSPSRSTLHLWQVLLSLEVVEARCNIACKSC